MIFDVIALCASDYEMMMSSVLVTMNCASRYHGQQKWLKLTENNCCCTDQVDFALFLQTPNDMYIKIMYSTIAS